MRDIVVIFAVLLVLLLLISTFGGSIRYNPPAPTFAPSYPVPSFPPVYGREMYAEKESVTDTLKTDDHQKAIPSAAVSVSEAYQDEEEQQQGAAVDMPAPDMSVEAFAQQDKEYAKW